jgi:hypothetical protein
MTLQIRGMILALEAVLFLSVIDQWRAARLVVVGGFLDD